jgi:hypothetical protein
MSQSKEMVALMRENAALCTLEAEIIMAIKYLEASNEYLARGQLRKIKEALDVVEVVRKRNKIAQGENYGENS